LTRVDGSGLLGTTARADSSQREGQQDTSSIDRTKHGHLSVGQTPTQEEMSGKPRANEENRLQRRQPGVIGHHGKRLAAAMRVGRRDAPQPVCSTLQSGDDRCVPGAAVPIAA